MICLMSCASIVIILIYCMDLENLKSNWNGCIISILQVKSTFESTEHSEIAILSIYLSSMSILFE